MVKCAVVRLRALMARQSARHITNPPIGYPYHALKVSLMQYQADPSTDFFHVVLPWVIYSPYIREFCGDRLTSKTIAVACLSLICLYFFVLYIKMFIDEAAYAEYCTFFLSAHS
jgi:hypothetical protein